MHQQNRWAFYQFIYLNFFLLRDSRNWTVSEFFSSNWGRKVLYITHICLSLTVAITSISCTKFASHMALVTWIISINKHFLNIIFVQQLNSWLYTTRKKKAKKTWSSVWLVGLWIASKKMLKVICNNFTFFQISASNRDSGKTSIHRFTYRLWNTIWYGLSRWIL